METADAIAAELGGAKPLGLLLGGTRDARLGCLDQRAHDVGLPPVVEVPAEARVRLRAAIVGHPGGDHRLAVGRWQRELTDLEVAVDGECEGSWNRGRGEMEDVRAPPLDEGRALRDPEPVLLVDDGHREIAEVDLLLDERMRPDDDLRIARRDQLPDHRVLLRAQRARQQRDTDTERSAQLVDREEVLLGQRLGRRHQRALTPQLDRAEQRVQCDDGLPRPDLALEETLHRERPVEVGVDLGHRAFLIRGERERERRAVAGA